MQSSVRIQFAFCILQFAIIPQLRADENIADSLAVREEAAFKAAVEQVAPSVVQIRTIGGLEMAERTLLPDGPTTGLVISPDGYIVSSAFNFVHRPASILVTLDSGKQSPAELIATDHSRMLVLLRATAVADLPVAKFAPVEETRPGQWAVAVGRTFRSDRTNISVGIISAVNRMFGKVIQTDADVSTANYGGPLVDIRGRVLGILVPMAPQGSSEVAGVEWYDSGIGFAVPLAPLAERIERMKKGDDQHAGLLGIGMAAKNPHSSAAVLAVVRPDAPAGQAGFKKGDRIVELNGKPIQTQNDLRFALGPLYGGDSVHVVAKRDDEQIERTVSLAGELPAFRHAFLGILPMRPAIEAPANDDADAADDADRDAKLDGKSEQDQPKEKAEAEEQSAPALTDANATPPQAQGIAVRMVYADSPAAQAGVVAGDRVVRIADTNIDSIASGVQAMSSLAPGTELTLRVMRAGEPIDLKITATRLPTNVPDNLPPAMEAAADVEAGGSPAAATAGETRELRLPEFPNPCHVYVPASHAAGQRQAALLWLHAPGEANSDEIIRQWQAICDRDNILLVAPTTTNNQRWERTDLQYLRRLMERVVADYKTDPNRVVVCGQEGGGAMAWMMGLASRDLFRGVAALAAPLPRQIRVPPNEPTQRLAIFAGIPSNKDSAAQIAYGLEKATDAGYNVTTLTTLDATGKLSDKERDELARWIDTLDRF